MHKISFLFSLSLVVALTPVSAAERHTESKSSSSLRTTLKLGGKFEHLPNFVDKSQSQKEGAFSELGFYLGSKLNDRWSYATDIRAFLGTSQITSDIDDIETGRTEKTSDTSNSLRLRQLWLRYHGLTLFPDEHITLGLQRIKSTSSLWWDDDIESVVWRLATTRLQFQIGAGQRFSTYRTNYELSQIDEEKLRLFFETNYDWTAYHELNLRSMYVHQGSEAVPVDVYSGTPDGVNGEWFWYGAGLSSNWTKRRSTSPFAYNLDWIGLTGQSNFAGDGGDTFEDHDIRAWALNAGTRYDLSTVPASFGLTFSMGSAGFDEEESNLFVQTGVQSNRCSSVGQGQNLSCYNDALRADLTNLIHGSFFASYTFDNSSMLTGMLSTFHRNDSDYPLYRNGRPLDLDRESDNVGQGIDISLRHNMDTSVLSIPLKYWRLRGSAFAKDDAFNDTSDDPIYRVIFEIVGVI